MIGALSRSNFWKSSCQPLFLAYSICQSELATMPSFDDLPSDRGSEK